MAEKMDAAAGHNSVAVTQLRSLVERIEKLAEEKATLSEDIGQIFAEAKGAGFDIKAMRILIRLRKMDANERQAQADTLATYANALGLTGVFG
jgi:uncharacterized protein (UPF0335 family)